MKEALCRDEVRRCRINDTEILLCLHLRSKKHMVRKSTAEPTSSHVKEISYSKKSCLSRGSHFSICNKKGPRYLGRGLYTQSSSGALGCLGVRR